MCFNAEVVKSEGKDAFLSGTSVSVTLSLSSCRPTLGLIGASICQP